MGSVLTWHMYQPRSDSCTLSRWRRHISRSWCERDTRWFRVMMLWWIVRMVCVSMRTHATCGEERKMELSVLIIVHATSVEQACLVVPQTLDLAGENDVIARPHGLERRAFHFKVNVSFRGCASLSPWSSMSSIHPWFWTCPTNLGSSRSP